MTDQSSEQTLAVTVIAEAAAPAAIVKQRGAIRAEAAAAANQAAADHVFAEHWELLAKNTRLRHEGELALFARYLAVVKAIDPAQEVAVGAALPYHASEWHNITWGLVKGFARWMLAEGYATSSVNVRLTTVKRYAKLARQAGAITEQEALLIASVRGYGGKQARNLDAGRKYKRKTKADGKPVKKAKAVRISDQQVVLLKQQPDTPQGRRDALLMALLLDHGLRVGEVAGLSVGSIDLAAGTLTFYREKVDLTQTLALETDVQVAAERYLQQDRPGVRADAPLFLASRKNGELVDATVKLGRSPDRPELRGQPFNARSIQKRVRLLGEAVGLQGLSPHDCRHCWTTRALQAKSNLTDVQHAGGWSSIAMVAHYANQAAIANEGVRLTRAAAADKED
jgi:integrase